MSAPKHPRLRPDLTWRRFVSEGADSFIFKDEITQEYVKLDEISGALALRLDGETSPGDLLAWAQASWPSLEFDLDYIADVIADLEKYKFIEDPFKRNALLSAVALEQRTQINAATFQNIFAIPLGTVNPDRFLTRTYPYIRWFFSPFCVGFGMALFLFALYLVMANRDHVGGRAASLLFGGGMTPLIALLMLVTIVFSTLIHELGHGYAVKHFGGKVEKMGFMSMVVMPCMFCDTSDSHMFANWKHRAAVAMAGTYTELYVAAFATVVWVATPSDLLVNQMAYNLMVYSSVSGILFNYNPLIKLDGYFVLADILDMPNLQEDAFEYVGYLFKRYVLRMRNEPCPAEGRRRKRVLAIYGVLSVAYSIVFTLIVFSILRLMLISAFAFAGAVVAALFLGLLLWGMANRLGRTTGGWALNHRGLIRRHQLPILAGVVALIALLLLLPVPGRRDFRVSMEPIRVAGLVAPERMRLKQADWSAGRPVAAGDLLAVLDAEVAQVGRGEAAAEEGALRISGAAARRIGQAGDAVIARAGELAAHQRSQLLERRVQRAELRAPFAGRVLTAATPGRLGETFEAGDTVCVVGDFSRMRATARLWEYDLEDIRAGAPVRVRLVSRPGRVLSGKVSAIQPAAELYRGFRLYRVWIALDEPPGDLRAGLTGKAWIATPSRPPAAHLIRMLARYVRLDLWV
jgi:putative peptide zinc metalloprotease protein